MRSQDLNDGSEAGTITQRDRPLFLFVSSPRGENDGLENGPNTDAVNFSWHQGAACLGGHREL